MFLLKELVYDGTRIISVNEGIHSTNESGHILATEYAAGKRRNKRNPANGKVTQIPAPDNDRVVDHRPALRIVPQPLWDLA